MISIFFDNFFSFSNEVLPWYLLLALTVGVYFLGNINPAILIGRAQGIDVRAQGSGNAGTTNALRSLGKKAGVITFIIDVVKGWVGYFVPYLIFARLAAQATEGVYSSLQPYYFAGALAGLCGLCVCLGHMYPVVFGFRGGKGVATAFGVLLAVHWLYALILLAIVIIFTAIFRYVSLSVMIAVAVAILIPIVIPPLFLFSSSAVPLSVYELFTSMSAAGNIWIIVILILIVWKHRENIGRLLKGEENKISIGGGSKGKE